MIKSKHLAVAGFFIALWGLFALGTVYLREPSDNYLFDYFPRWYGARQVIFEGSSNPYSVEIEKDIQEEMLFEEHIPYKHNFLYPAPVIYILLPFWLLPWEASISLWAGLTITLALVLPLMVFLTFEWRISPILLLLFTFSSAFVYRHTMHIYLLGQFLMVIAASWIISWWATSHKKPAISAIALIFATIRPEGALIAGAMLFDLLRTRHYKTIAIWTGIMAGLLALSFLQLGWWVDNMMTPLRGYRECCQYTYPAAQIPGGRPIELVFTGMVIVWAAWMLMQMLKLPDLTRIPWSLSTVIVAYLLVLTQSKDYTLVYLLIPLWVSLWSSRGHWLSSLVVLALLASPWIYWRSGLTLPDDNPKEQLFTPVFTGIVLTAHWLYWKKSQVATQVEANPVS